MISLEVLFELCISNIDMLISMYDLSVSEICKLKKIRRKLEVYLREKNINNN